MLACSATKAPCIPWRAEALTLAQCACMQSLYVRKDMPAARAAADAGMYGPGTCGGLRMGAKHSRIILPSYCKELRLCRLPGAPPDSEYGRRRRRTSILPSVRPAARADALRKQGCRLRLEASSDGARHRAHALAQPCMQVAAAAEAPSCAAPRTGARRRGCKPSAAQQAHPVLSVACGGPQRRAGSALRASITNTPPWTLDQIAGLAFGVRARRACAASWGQAC